MSISFFFIQKPLVREARDSKKCEKATEGTKGTRVPKTFWLEKKWLF